MDLEIDPLIPVPAKTNKVGHPLGDKFSLLIVGPSRSGKSNIVLNIITKWYVKHFDDIYLLSVTAYRPSSGWLIMIEEGIIPEANVIDDVSLVNEFIEALIEKQKAQKKSKNIMVIIDDIAKEIKMSKQLESIFTRGRHYDISVILISQTFMNISPTIRGNSTNDIFLRINDEKELDAIVREKHGLIPKKIFRKMFLEVTNKPFNFLFVDNNEIDYHQKFRKNFKTKIEVDID